MKNKPLISLFREFEFCLLAKGNYSVVVFNHGIYVPQVIVAEKARTMGIRVVTWHLAYRKCYFIFNHDETYHHGLLSEPVSAWQDMRWGETQAREIAGCCRMSSPMGKNG